MHIYLRFGSVFLQAHIVDQVRECDDSRQKARGQDQRGRRRRIEGAVRTLVGAAHLANTEDVQRRGVEGLDVEALRPQRLNDDGLSSSCEVGNWEIPEI